MLTLDKLKPGQECRIVEVHTEGVEGQRLLDMGLVSGTRVRVIRNAPLRDPMNIRIRGYGLALRHSEARGIEVVIV